MYENVCMSVCEHISECWELNLGHLEEWPVLLSTQSRSKHSLLLSHLSRPEVDFCLTGNTYLARLTLTMLFPTMPLYTSLPAILLCFIKLHKLALSLGWL